MKLIEKAKIGFMDAILKNDSIEALCEAAYELLNWPMIVGRDTQTHVLFFSDAQ